MRQASVYLHCITKDGLMTSNRTPVDSKPIPASEENKIQMGISQEITNNFKLEI